VGISVQNQYKGEQSSLMSLSLTYCKRQTTWDLNFRQNLLNASTGMSEFLAMDVSGPLLICMLKAG